MIYDAQAHEPLRGGTWDARRARRGIDDIVEDALDAFARRTLWSAHPLDTWAPGPLDVRQGGIYAGAPGAVYALRTLREQPPVSAHELLASTEGDSFISGALGIALVAWAERPTEDVAERIEAAAALTASGENELCWGAAGAAVAASLLFEATRDERWTRVADAAVRALWTSWTFDRHVRACVWTQRRPDGARQFLGAAHGVAGNAHALLRNAPMQSPAHQRELLDRVADTLSRSARRERGLVNWPARADAPDARPRVQWCHGAPGVVTALAAAPRHAKLDALLVEAGELVWAAGPLAKGPSLCHGTAGNGFTFLKLHRRTRDSKWLDRARRFAMHALAQVEAMRAEHGRGRYSLFLGDLGVALYLRACIDVDDRWPLLDVL